MAAKKEIRADNTYIISADSTDNPKLGAKILSDGRESLFLDFYLGYVMATSSKTGKEYKRVNNKREYLSLYLWQATRTPIERQQNKETLQLAKEIRHEREQELKDGTLGYRLKAKAVNFFDFIQSYYDEYTKGDKRMIKAAQKRFTDFIALEYPLYKCNISPEKITPDMMEHFVGYLQSISKGEGALTHWKRWKKIVKAAVKKDILRKNPCEDIVCKADEEALKKDILSIEEMQQLIATTYKGQNSETRRAFIFTLYTGIRFCDIKDLTFANVDYSNRVLTFNQKKTQGHSSKSYVNIPLNNSLLALIGTASTNSPDEKIFKLPSQEMCLKALRHWTAKAGITKHITWHCGRHSFAVNILNNGANIKTVASLLGHSSIQHTEKYTRAVDSLKQEAINSLPTLEVTNF
ncbi:site-specific integrase [Tannerella forsythia]|uniref:Site-specific integrase n=1 Tax=Tannerella forsythia TaxID=28112 RepID=A0A3P1XMN9_TANFO|nr:site-specific integrase [Tannerella forsythia]RRD59328.1 site-specific integrase [Tannerella forsythia]